MSLDLWYWPGIPGRGEFIRLPLEAAGVPYRDAAQEDGVEALLADMEARGPGAVFAPPYVAEGDFTIAQTAHILAWLADRHGFGADDLTTDLRLIQLQLTVMDIVDEAHAVHHPISGSLYYHEQKAEAARRAVDFRNSRIPKFLDHFEAAVAQGDGPFLLGERWSYIDTSLFQLIEGLRYAFPRRMAALAGDYPCLGRLHEAVAALDGLADYLSSSRRPTFSEDGIFRHYPELDPA
ncbi:glutathione S-transferase [Altererythrobacter sp. B11]|uniref:glutathione S-transferase n=1 Tax=Altererythrobacter sp. B11 TaxID=2060312 RepID=UPI000DC6DA0E|nr:glutathione S-transferase [Altererythrobacter sp. B11]BBC73782.1 glutathione S-transferase [Altererythrobacter sp. B11]